MLKLKHDSSMHLYISQCEDGSLQFCIIRSLHIHDCSERSSGIESLSNHQPTKRVESF